MEHLDKVSQDQRARESTVHIEIGLDLLAYAIEEATRSMHAGPLTSNELASIACYTRSFRAIRVAAMLATSGFVLEARVYVRDVYESSSMARYLAREPAKADIWLSDERWIKDNEVRQYVQKFTAPGIPIKDSPYSQFYEQSSQIHHPTARGCIPLVYSEETKNIWPQLVPQYDAEHAANALHEIAMETVFVCFTFMNALADPAVMPVEWRKDLKELAEAVAREADWSHLDRDWDEEQAKFEALRAQALDADELEQYLDNDPNSVRNRLRRQTGPGH
ncbi:hypothetical protein BA062_01245 [Prauserella flavalba]|uniref:Uncharacterized protein n=1 Tax=Prauserella flavalba TaxID=1477506 RepID=A0A318MGY3_9PSEU|nr:hypothetical protein BA062_01245 [Prauserella flavalba]